MIEEYRFIPHEEAAAYLAAGWNVKPLRGYHGVYSCLAWRLLAGPPDVAA
jgi:hypothetical protein